MMQAMIRLINPEARTGYFLIGDGEQDINGSDQTAMSKARSTLESKNYTVKTLNLAAENAIPADAKALIVAGPSKPLDEQEVALIAKYLQGGGALVVMENPVPLTEFGDAPDPLATYLETDWGIRLRNDIIIDTQGNPATVAVSEAYDPAHPITHNLNNLRVAFPFARSIETLTAPEGVTVTPLAQTIDRSWGETDFEVLKNQGQVAFDQGKDVIGPMTMAAAAERTSPTKQRVVVFGNALFAADATYDTGGNGDIFINAVDWAAEQESQIGLTPKTPTQRTFTPPGQLQWILILLGSVFVLPGIVLVAGIASWISRRRRG